MKQFIYVLLLSSLAIISAHAKGSGVVLTSSSLQERVVINQAGEEELVLAPVAKIVPGDIVIYKNDIVNKGKRKASDLVLRNSIPQHMEYVDDSSRCLHSQGCHIVFSIDGGRTFKSRNQLYSTDEEGQVVLAQAKEITTIKWTISTLKAGGHNQVQFKARLK